jgi:hypothetical protein
MYTSCGCDPTIDWEQYRTIQFQSCINLNVTVAAVLDYV